MIFLYPRPFFPLKKYSSPERAQERENVRRQGVAWEGPNLTTFRSVADEAELSPQSTSKTYHDSHYNAT